MSSFFEKGFEKKKKKKYFSLINDRIGIFKLTPSVVSPFLTSCQVKRVILKSRAFLCLSLFSTGVKNTGRGSHFSFWTHKSFVAVKKKNKVMDRNSSIQKTCPPLKEEKMEHQKWFDWPFTLRGNLSFIGRSNFSLSFKREAKKKKNKRRPCAFWKHFYSIAIESTRRKFVLCRSISFWMHYRRTKEPVSLFEHWKSTCCLFQQQQKNLFRYQTLLPIRWGL